MPYYVEVQRSNYSFPEICPFCEKRPASSTFTYSKIVYSGFYILAYTYKTWTFKLPICKGCETETGRLLLGGVGLIVLAIVAQIVLSVSKNTALISFMEYVPHISLATGVLLILIRWWRLRRFKIAYIGDKSFTLQTDSESYALKLARSNNTRFEKKLFYVRMK